MLCRHLRCLFEGQARCCPLWRRLDGLFDDRLFFGGEVVFDQVQGLFLDHQARVMQSGDILEPGLLLSSITHPFCADFDALTQTQSQLRSEACGQTKGVADGVVSSFGEIERSQLGVHLPMIGDGRHPLVLQHAHSCRVFNARGHGVAGETLGVGDDDVLGVFTEGLAQSGDFRAGAAASGRGVGFVGNENGLSGQGRPVEPMLFFHAIDETGHHAGDVLGVQACAVEGAVGDFRSQ